MREVKGINFLHGTAMIENMLMAFFYFTDLDWGMVMTTDETDQQGYITRFRLIAQEKNDFDFSDRQN